MNSEPHIDENMKELVDLINRFPDISTIACCGGHKETTCLSQVPKGEWYVTITKTGPMALVSIAALAYAEQLLYSFVCEDCLDEGGEVRIALFYNADLPPEQVNWEDIDIHIHGKDPITPAHYIEALAAVYDSFFGKANEKKGWVTADNFAIVIGRPEPRKPKRR